MKQLLLKWIQKLFKKEKFPYSVLYLENGKVIKSKEFRHSKKIVGICLTNEVIYHPLSKDNSYCSNREGFYNSNYYGTWAEAIAFFSKVEVPGYKVVAAPIDVLVSILDDYRNINSFLAKLGMEPLHEDWYYWSGTTSDNEKYAWDYCNDRTGRGQNEYAKSAYLKTEKNHFLGILIPE